MELSNEITVKANAIYNGAQELYKTDGSTAVAMACALALLTSQVKAEREKGKQLVRDWRHGLKNPA